MTTKERIEAGSLNKRLEAANVKIKAQQRRMEILVETMQNERRTKKVVLPVGKKKFRLKGDIIRVTANDLHGAKMHRASVAAFLADIGWLKPAEIIFNGDMTDCGGFLAEHHVMGYVAETDYSYTDDIAATNGFLDRVQEVSPDSLIEYIEGNHERRVETWCVTESLRHKDDAEMLRLAIAPEFKLCLKERGINYYRQSVCYDGLHIPGVIKRGKIYYLHGISTAKNAAAETLKKVAGNVNYAHTHRAQSDVLRPMSTGEIGAWNPGCLCELQPLWQHTRPTDWSHGYSVEFISRTGKFVHLNVGIIDGESLLTPLLKNDTQAANHVSKVG